LSVAKWGSPASALYERDGFGTVYRKS
jgi:hypothetical protein